MTPDLESGEIALSCRSHSSIDGSWPLGCNLNAFDSRVPCLIPLDTLGSRVAVLHPPLHGANQNASVFTWHLSAPLVIQNALPFEIRSAALFIMVWNVECSDKLFSELKYCKAPRQNLLRTPWEKRSAAVGSMWLLTSAACFQASSGSA